MPIQKHLSKTDTINLGSFYTPKFIVEIAYKIMENHINLNDFTLLDSSCGYGDFFIKNLRYVGADIDDIALKSVPQNVKKIHTNSLLNLSREKFDISQNEPLIIIGNPPYNDKTSIIRNNVKKEIFDIDANLNHRDLGISFLRSFAELQPEFVCVLHPLSYLIKRTNFNALAKFKNSYRLIDGLIISSEIFMPNSNTFFPIIIALYEKNRFGMNYDFIKDYKFKTYEGNSFRLNDFDFIGSYVQKYPNHYDKREPIAYFHTLRDINALKRNQTFMKTPNSNSVKVFNENLKYYCYIHHFKKFASNLPYYFGNLDVFIDNDEFLKISDEFLNLNNSPKIDRYFNDLLIRRLTMATMTYDFPLTKTSGKIRIKERLTFDYYGTSVAPTKTKMTQKHYIEWQIGYDNIVSKLEKFDFIGANGKPKILYELSEFIKFGFENSLVSRRELENLKFKIENNQELIDEKLEILRADFKEKQIGNIKFLSSFVSYPLLVYRFNLNDMICEIIVREKQYASGIMPMLYFCLPISALKGGDKIIGREIASGEIGVLEISEDNINIFIKMFEIFGILSQSHKHDTIEILNTILR